MASLLTLNGLDGSHYVEPFAGGAAVALDLLFSGASSRITINDADTLVYNFWRAAVFDTDKFVEKISACRVDLESWVAAREIKRSPAGHSPLDVGFAVFFLSRTNRSGILNGGVIGGLEQKGNWKLDCRFNKNELISKIRRIGFHRSRISVCNADAADLISGLSPSLKNGFFYLDPPYYNKGAYLYQNYFKDADHVRIAEKVADLPSGRWVVSYDNVPRIAELYRAYRQAEFRVDYSARSYVKATELMIFAPGLLTPPCISWGESDQGAAVATLTPATS